MLFVISNSLFGNYILKLIAILSLNWEHSVRTSSLRSALEKEPVVKQIV